MHYIYIYVHTYIYIYICVYTFFLEKAYNACQIFFYYMALAAKCIYLSQSTYRIRNYRSYCYYSWHQCLFASVTLSIRYASLGDGREIQEFGGVWGGSLGY